MRNSKNSIVTNNFFIALTKKIFSILVVFIISFANLASTYTTINAADPDFDTSHTLELYLQPGQDYVEVREKLHLKVNTTLFLYPAGYMQEMYITPISSDYQGKLFDEEMAFSRDSLQVFINGQANNSFTTENTPQGIKVLIPQDYNIDSYNPYEAEIRYNSHQYIDVNGNISNIYTPQIPTIEDSKTDSNGLKTNFHYTQKIIVPDSQPSHSYYSPSNIRISSENGFRVYTIDQETIKNNMGWVQIGTEQYTYFKIEQQAPISDNFIPESISNISSLLSTNIYEIILPREFEETDQEIYIKNIQPEPKLLYHDEEGNLIGRWEVPANQESLIIIEGYIKQQLHSNSTNIQTITSAEETDIDTEVHKIYTDVTYEDLDKDLASNQTLGKFLNADTYWQTDDPTISELANTLKADNEKIYDVVLADYNYIVEELDYSYDKISQFNQRIGAIRALNGEATVCMEYADSLITLLRAQGIPARPAFGYGNDPLLDNEQYNQDVDGDSDNTNDTGAGDIEEISQDNNTYQKDEKVADTDTDSDSDTDTTSQNNRKNQGHQWVQVWFPDYGWMTVDPTWGETKRLYIGPDLEHVLWYTASSISTSPIDSMVYSANITAPNAYNNYSIVIYPIPASQFPDITTLKSVDQIATISDKRIVLEQDKLDFIIKTNPLGKTALIVLPVCVTLVLFIVIITLIASQIRRHKNQKLSSESKISRTSNTSGASDNNA